MDPNTHQKELQQLFPDQKLTFLQSRSIPMEVITSIKRELTRLEIGHCFSLGMTKIKRSGDGISITFDLTKALLNFQP